MGAERCSQRSSQYFATFSVCIGAIAAGTVLSWTGNISDGLKSGELNSISVTIEQLEWIGSLTSLGAMVISFPIGFLANKFGRKLATLTLVVPFIVGWALMIFAPSVEFIYAGRFIAGLASGGICVTAPLYTNEIAEKEIRGALGSFFQIFISLGVLLSFLVASLADIKTFSLICASFPLIFFVLFVLQPESPIYLINKRNYSAAHKSLKRLRGPNHDIEAEIKQIELFLESNKIYTGSFLTAIQKPAAIKAAIISFGLFFFQQFSGVKPLVFYTVEIFNSADVHYDSNMATVVLGMIKFGSTFLSTIVVDRFGRKALLITSALLMALSHLLVGIFFTLKNGALVSSDILKTLEYLPIVGLGAYFIAFALGFGSIVWFIAGEVFPPEIKTVGCSAACTLGWLFGFFMTKFFLTLAHTIGFDMVFYILGGIALLGMIFVIFFVPETSRKTFEEIQCELGK